MKQEFKVTLKIISLGEKIEAIKLQEAIDIALDKSGYLPESVAYIKVWEIEEISEKKFLLVENKS